MISLLESVIQSRNINCVRKIGTYQLYQTGKLVCAAIIDWGKGILRKLPLKLFAVLILG